MRDIWRDVSNCVIVAVIVVVVLAIPTNIFKYIRWAQYCPKCFTYSNTQSSSNSTRKALLVLPFHWGEHWGPQRGWISCIIHTASTSVGPGFKPRQSDSRAPAFSHTVLWRRVSWAGDGDLGATDPKELRVGFLKNGYRVIRKEREMWALRNPTSKGKGLEDGARVLTSGKGVWQECKGGKSGKQTHPCPKGPSLQDQGGGEVLQESDCGHWSCRPQYYYI